jgi:hypothetical protein
MEEYYDAETQTLRIPFYYDKKLENIPEGTKIIIFEEFNEIEEHSEFNESVDFLPLSIIQIKFGTLFNKSVDKLPINLQFLELGNEFVQPVDNLPVNLQSLKFGHDFNQPVDNLPVNLQSLKFGYRFNQPVDKLPVNLKILKFGRKFNQSIDLLPTTITHLTFSYMFDKPVNCFLPELTYLGFYCNSEIKDNIPLTVDTVKIYFFKNRWTLNRNVENLPSTIKKIILNKMTYRKYITKIPFGCEVVEKKNLSV